MPDLLRARINRVGELGGDTRFFEFAATAPHVVDFYWGSFYRDLFFGGALPVRVKELVRLRLAGLNGCSFCQVGDRESARGNGLTDDEIDAVFAFQDEGFEPSEAAVLAAATQVSNAVAEGTIDDDLRRQLVQHYSDEQLVELLTVLGILTGMAKMLAAAGFIETSCPIPSRSIDGD